jgi:hypothetical protein
MKTLQQLTGAVVLGLMLGFACYAQDPPPPVCGHMDTMKCDPSAPTQSTDDPTGGQDTGLASYTDAALSVLETVLQAL